MLTQKRLKHLLHYDPVTGVFKWQVQQAYTVPVGTIAGWNNGKGSKRIQVDGNFYLAHRLAWFYIHGTWHAQIDHINRDRTDNRLSNLRPADNSQNQANQEAKSNNNTGYRGVSFMKGKYVVQLTKRKNGQKIHICRKFKALADAVEFSRVKSRELHGEFSIYHTGD